MSTGGAVIAFLLGHASRQPTILRLRREAYHDRLTGLPNRPAAEREYRRLQSVRPVALALLDLGEFKVFNDTYGHPAGDSLLIEVAERLKLMTFDLGGIAAR